MLEHYSHARITAKREAVEGPAKASCGTIVGHHRLFHEDDVPQVLEKNGGREGIRTPGLLLANQATNLKRLDAATT